MGAEGDAAWRKLHLGVDGSRVIVACALTEPTADDAMTGISLVDEVDGHLTRVTADPAYDTRAFYGAAGARGRDGQHAGHCSPTALNQRTNAPRLCRSGYQPPSATVATQPFGAIGLPTYIILEPNTLRQPGGRISRPPDRRQKARRSPIYAEGRPLRFSSEAA